MGTIESDPYCKICSSCGEAGCCSPLMCEQHKEGTYCQSNLAHLKFGYAMWNWLDKAGVLDNLTEEQKKGYDEEWNKQYDVYYNVM